MEGETDEGHIPPKVVSFTWFSTLKEFSPTVSVGPSFFLFILLSHPPTNFLPVKNNKPRSRLDTPTFFLIFV